MWAHFKSLRRKIGIVTLVMACVCFVAWIRSFQKMDRVIRSSNGALSSVTLYHGSLYWFRVTPSEGETSTRWRSSDAPTAPISVWQDYEPTSRLNWCGFDFGAGRSKNGSEIVLNLWAIPCWSIVLPLTLLSAWFLLSKPRTGKPEPTLEV